MALFFTRPKPQSYSAGGCPQPPCGHHSHNGVPVPCRYCGTSRHQGMVLHHVRCVLNPGHHLVFTRIGHRWHRVRT
jgi:hypothetical protein